MKYKFLKEPYKVLDPETPALYRDIPNHFFRGINFISLHEGYLPGYGTERGHSSKNDFLQETVYTEKYRLQYNNKQKYELLKCWSGARNTVKITSYTP